MVLNLRKEREKTRGAQLPGRESEVRQVSHLFQQRKAPSLTQTPKKGVDVGGSFLRVPMRDCLRLIESYSLEMVRGFGLADADMAASVLKTIFDRQFLKENQKIKRNFANFTRSSLEFKFLMESLKKFRQGRLAGEKPRFEAGSGFQKNIRDFDFYAQNHFPLCMYEMYRSFKAERHLKHNGRLQLILFIKGLGFKAEEVIQLFRGIVAKGPAAGKVKEYEYMIRHSYGLVGGKTEYSGMGCPKIMANSRPSKGDVHGCPFSYYGEDALSKLLLHKVGNALQVREILKSNALGPKFGCRKFFCAKNKLLDIEDVDDGIGRHPNIYFNVSYYRKGRKRDFKPRPKEQPSSNKIQPELVGPA